MPWAENHKQKHAAYMREWRKTHPMSEGARRKDICRSYAREYLKRGILKKAPCFFCGSESSQMHHPDYNKPLDVVWTCDEHHRWIHRVLAFAKTGPNIVRVQKGSVTIGVFHVETPVIGPCENDK